MVTPDCPALWSECEEGRCVLREEAAEINCITHFGEFYAWRMSALEARSHCSGDEDCAVVDDGLSCRGSCGAAMAVEEVEAFLEEVAQKDGEYCTEEVVEACGVVTPDCALYEAECQEGQCTLVEAAIIDCEGLYADLDAAVESFLGEHQACGQDEDCVLLDDSLSCQGRCGAALASDATEDFVAFLASLEEDACTEEVIQTCSVLTPDCEAMEAQCVDDRCVGVALTPP